MPSKAKVLSQLWSAHLAHTAPWVLYLNTHGVRLHTKDLAEVSGWTVRLSLLRRCSYLGLTLLVKKQGFFLSPFPTTGTTAQLDEGYSDSQVLGNTAGCSRSQWTALPLVTTVARDWGHSPGPVRLLIPEASVWLADSVSYVAAFPLLHPECYLLLSWIPRLGVP